MKKRLIISIVVLVVVLLFTLVGCSSSGNSLLSVTDAVCFKEGSAAGGKVVIASGDIVGFYSEYDEGNDAYQIVFKLTENGKELFSTETTKLAEEGGGLSLWVGDEKIASPRVMAPITDGAVALSFDEENINIICDKLQGK